VTGGRGLIKSFRQKATGHQEIVAFHCLAGADVPVISGLADRGGGLVGKRREGDRGLGGIGFVDAF